MMPRAYHSDWRDAKDLQENRDKAEVLAKWTRLIFWCYIINLAVSLLDFIPMLRTVGGALDTVMMLVIVYGYFRMREADPRFVTVAVLGLGVLAIGGTERLLPEESGLGLLLGLVTIVCAIIQVRVKCTVFSELLAKISQQMSEKWYTQWTLTLTYLCILLGSVLVLFVPVLGLLGILAIIVAIGLAVFTVIREYVCLYRTAAVCASYSAGEFVD